MSVIQVPGQSRIADLQQTSIHTSGEGSAAIGAGLLVYLDPATGLVKLTADAIPVGRVGIVLSPATTAHGVGGIKVGWAGEFDYTDIAGGVLDTSTGTTTLTVTTAGQEIMPQAAGISATATAGNAAIGRVLVKSATVGRVLIYGH